MYASWYCWIVYEIMYNTYHSFIWYSAHSNCAAETNEIYLSWHIIHAYSSLPIHVPTYDFYCLIQRINCQRSVYNVQLSGRCKSLHPMWFGIFIFEHFFLIYHLFYQGFLRASRYRQTKKTKKPQSYIYGNFFFFWIWAFCFIGIWDHSSLRFILYRFKNKLCPVCLGIL